MTNEYLTEHYDIDIPLISAQQQGTTWHASPDRTTWFCTNRLTDRVGHKKRPDEAITVLELLDHFLDGLWTAVAPDTTVVISSDHGNIEDLRRSTHTTNPVPLLVHWPGANAFRQPRHSLTLRGGSLKSWKDSTTVHEQKGQICGIIRNK